MPKLIRSVAACLVVGVSLTGCGGDADTSIDQPGDEATRAELGSAYAALEQAAEELPKEEFATFQRSAIREARRSRGKLTSTDYLALADHLSEREVTFGVALTEPTIQAEVDNVLSGIEFNNDSESLTLIAPPRLGHSPPAELIGAGATFAAISPSGQVFCLGPDDEDARPCDAPELPSPADDNSG